jgi:diguanylate cyclase (GGDEF)-like protein/PAS domain S-box-containing protein
VSRTVRRRRPSIAVQLLAVFAVATALTATMVVINVRTEFGQARKSAAAEAVREARTQAHDLSGYYGTQLTPSLKALAGQPGLRNAQPGRCQPAVQSVAALIGGGGVALVAPSGQLFCAAGAYSPAAGTAWFSTALHKGLGVGGPVIDRRTGTAQLGLAYAMTTAGGPAVLVIEQNSQKSMLSAVSSRLELYVVDRASGVVLDSLPHAKKTQTLPAALRNISPGRTLSAVGPSGVRGIYAGQPVAGTPWWVLAAVPRARAMAPATDSLRRNVVLGGVMVIALLGLGWVVYRRIARPARRLRKAIDHLAETDALDHSAVCVPDDAPRELAELGEALNDMVAARQRTEARLASLVRHASDLVFIVDVTGVVTYATPSAESLLCLGGGDMLGRPFLDLVHPEDRERLGRRLQRGENNFVGNTARIEFRIVSPAAVRDVEARTQNLVDDPAIRGSVVTCHDITDRKRAEVELAHAAMHDSLTGLPNRALALDRLRHLLARTGRSGATSAVLFVDLDRFKLVNDSTGHAAGDELLVLVAERLSTLTRPGDTLARFGGDEFVIVCESLASTDAAGAVAERVLEGMQPPFTVRGQETFVTASIGIAIAQPGDDAGDLLRDADAALYRAKDRGRARWAMFDDGMRAQVQRRLEVGNKLRRALTDPGLFLEFQPVVSLDRHAAVGVEALVRWQDGPTIVRPDEFIPVAEETGLIVPIGEWVLRESCRQLVHWRRSPAFPRDTRISVNVSARQIGQADFADTVARILAETGLDPNLLVIEVTESVLMLDREAGAAMLSRLRALGVAISIDDFGTGYSSLGYLQRLPIDELKIDRSFVGGLGRDERTTPILESIVSLGHAVGLTLVAEGVESPRQAELLAAMGCDKAQGYLFAQPLSASAVVVHLQAAGISVPR